MEKQTARLEAFSDGIFGVAITLLAIEIGIDRYEGANNSNLWKNILAKWPEYFAYFNSFATILLIWMGHSKMLDHIRKANQPVTLTNGALLLFVVLFPFPTRIVAKFIYTDAQNTAVCFYAAFTGLIALNMYLLVQAIIKNKDIVIEPGKDTNWLYAIRRGQFIAMVVYGVAAITAFVSPMSSMAMTFGMWIFWAFTTK